MPDLTIPVYGRGFPTGAGDPRRGTIPHAGPPGEPETPGDQGGRRAHGVQFTRALTPEEEEELSQQLGISFDAYIPEFTYLVLADDQTLSALRQHPLYNADFRYGARFKTAPGIGTREFQTERRRQIAPDLLLWAVLFRNADVDAVKTRLQDLGARDLADLDDRDEGGDFLIEFVLPAGASVAAVAAIEGIRWLEEAPEGRSNMPLLAGLVQSGIPDDTPYWDHELRGQQQVIGVLDSGRLDLGHCWFKDDGDNNPRPGHRKVVHNDALSAEGEPLHCAFVSGIIAGDDKDDSGGHPDRGVAWAAKLAYANRKDFERTPPERLPAYLARARAAKARIHSNSWHDHATPNYTVRAHQFDRFAWRNEDCLIVASSGNSDEGFERGPPGTAKNSLCVSAGFVGAGVSCFGDGIPGPTDDGRRKPDLLAPGCKTTSAETGTTCATVSDAAAGAASPATCEPTARCASSFATPVVAAAAAIVRQYFLEGWHPDGDRTSPHADPRDPTGALVKAVLLNAANKTTTCPDFPSNVEGWGMLQMQPILRLAGGASKLWIRDVPHADGFRIGGDAEHLYTLRVAGAPLKVTLVWTDYPGDPWAQRIRVNDLDLEVTEPGVADPFKGNVFAGNQSIRGGAADQLNTVEMVYVPAPTAGDWQIRVKATTLAKVRPGLGYALVVSGDVSDPPA
jgi:hypothetical protein